MLKAILFDLDDTLLGNEIDNFMKHYFMLLGQYAQKIMDPQQFISELLICTRTMIASTDTNTTNRDVFWQTFSERRNIDEIDELEAYFDVFYRDTFLKLRPQTQCRASAARLVQHCIDQDLQVVVATNPVFPTIAIEHRLDWAGLSVRDFPFALVTTYSNMHTTKPHPSYYEEILEKIGCEPEAALMVGDSWENDIVPAASLGLATYWIADENEGVPNTAVSLTAQGSLEKLEDMIYSGFFGEMGRG